ncbi:zeta toxin family protein [Nocardioides aquiterrae]|uniref:UDP-N-acetylglucosamine kinase n=1 Tax=Nocardioides aquiterrae TaxID=203799 RepID=A0ABN1UBJ6_9ACTN
MSDAVRARVAAELEELSAPGHELHSESPRSTWVTYGDTVARLRTWEELIEEFTSLQEGITTDGRIAIVTAGPPGSGKSTTTTAILEAGDNPTSYRRIDPDVIKDLLLDRAIKDGLYEPLLQKRLSDGLPIMPRELSGLVHEESTRLAREIRRRCMRKGENVVVEGTLSWPDMIDVHLRELTEAGYDALHVVSVEVPKAVAAERVMDRWWAGRNDLADSLGGRFVPIAVIDGCWDEDGDPSRCDLNARELFRRARRQEGLVVTLTTSQDDLGEANQPGTDIRDRALRAMESD